MLSASYQFCCFLFAIIMLFLPLWYFSYKHFPLFFLGGIFLGENIADLEELRTCLKRLGGLHLGDPIPLLSQDLVLLLFCFVCACPLVNYHLRHCLDLAMKPNLEREPGGSGEPEEHIYLKEYYMHCNCGTFWGGGSACTA